MASEVLDLIKEGRVKMKPKAYFIMKTSLLCLAVAALGLFIFYLVSFIIFALKASGAVFLPSLGLAGLAELLLSLPWLLIFAAVFLLVVLEILVKHFSFVYRRPVLYSLAALLCFVAFGSFVVAKSGLHDNLFLRAQNNNLPLVGVIYHNLDVSKHHRWCQAMVLCFPADGWVLVQEASGRQIRIVTTTQTFFPFGQQIERGDILIILGDKNEDVVRVNAVRKVRSCEDNCWMTVPSPAGQLKF